MIRYGSVCSGIEAVTVAWHGLGFVPAFFSEIDPAPRAVLAHRWPGVPLHGDFTTIGGDEYGAIDLLVGGTPCQSFSVAGLRGGMGDARGNLAIEFLKLAHRTRARWVVFENVPGLLSSNGGRDFGSFLGGLAELGYGWSYAVLDAQWFGVPQRRRRVFVVGYLGDWRRAAAVLFERHGLSGHPAPRRETGQGTPAFASIGAGEYGAGVGSLRAKGADCGGGSETLIAHSLRAEGFDAGEDGTGRGTPLVPVAAIQERAICENPDAGPDGAGFRTDGVAYTLEARTVPQAIAFTGGASDIITREAIAFDTTQITSAANYSNPRPGDPCRPLAAGAHAPAVAFNLRGREGGAQPEADPDNLAVMRAASGGSSRSYLAFAQNSRDEVRLHGGDGQSVGALAAEPGMKQTCYVAFTAKDHGGDAMEDCSPTLRAGGHSRSHANAGVMPAVCLGGNAETMYGVSHGTTSETNTVEALRALRGAVGEEAYSEWCLGIIAAFWPQEVLRSGLYGKGLRQPPQPKRGLVNVALSRSQIGSGWSVRDLWEAGCDGCPPQGWRPSEQLAGQLGSYLSRLPYSPSPAERFVQHLWEADEGPGILRYALSKVQEIRRSIVGQGQPVLPDQDGSGEEPDQDMQDDGLRQDRPCSRPLRDARHATAQVRRLVVEECEALQGFPRSYTLVPYRGGMMADGPRYKCLGNSMAVPVVRWIGQRILMVEALGAVEQAVAA